MKAREVVLDLYKKSGISNATLAHRVGLSLTTCWDLTSNPNRTNDMATRLLVPVLRALDYKLVAMPRDAKVPEDSYVID